ncbi:Fpg/Nei family DNA glycosylase [Nakamurella lactea]|uniref:Fpg/Nei family DNA glycosylase n=1 Tax=Nakamurella lactea TaxID=459515 RepID=UPI00048FC867
MPEGHTLHRLAAEFTERFRGLPTRSSSPQGRFVAESLLIDGRRLDDAEAHGKHLFLTFGERIVHVHLGLAGKIGFTDGDPPPVIGAIRWRLTTEAPHSTADLRGPAACELLTPGEVDALTARLGPDPLRPDADPDAGWRRITRSRTPIAALLMDQRVAAGVGNIYRAELLYRHRIDPMMEGRLLKPGEWQAMWADLQQLMRHGVQTGRIDTVRPEHEPEAMGRPPRVDAHGGEVYVYRRAGQPCLVCRSKVRIAELAGRNLFWCPGCQRRTRRRGR